MSLLVLDVVGNGWRFRDLGEAFPWRRHNALVAGERLWHATPPGTRVADVGLRRAMRAVPLDPTCVKGGHGRLPDGDEDAPLLLSSSPRFARDRVRATDVRQLLLDHLEESWPDR